MNAENIEVKVWEYIDGILPPEEHSFIENLVQTNQEWRSKYAELLQIQSMMSDNFQLDEPSMSFTRNVMEEIGRIQITKASKKYLNARVIWGIGGFFVLSIIGFIVYAFSQATWSESSSSVLPRNLQSMNFDRLLSSTYTNIFLMINTVLGLVLLDMYLAAKRKRFNAEQG